MQVAITAQGSGLTVTRQVTVQVRPFRLPIRRPPHPIIVSPPLL
jgi:hypothetical protein